MSLRPLHRHHRQRCTQVRFISKEGYFSENNVRDVESRLASLPPEIWAGGENHLIFVHYHGTFPDYADHKLGFDTGKAMVARASASVQNFRQGFDLAFPLFHAGLPLRSRIEVLHYQE